MATTRVRTTVHHDEIQMLVDRPGEIRRWFDRKVATTVVVAREEAPVRSGELRRKISSTYWGGGKWIIRSAAPHTMLITTGTRPHKIRPRMKKVLRWEQDGRVIFAREVNHPGTEPNPFLIRALRRVWGSRL